MSVQYPTPVCRTPHCRTIAYPGYADGGLCERCELDGLGAIAALPYDHADLEPLIWDKQSRGPGVTSGVFGPSYPVDLEADALRGEIEWAALQWDEIVRHREGPGRLSDPTGDINVAARTLTAHLDTLISTPPWPVCTYDRKVTDMDGVDAVMWMTRLHRRAVARTGVADAGRLPGYCWECGRGDVLRHRNGTEHVRCSRCAVTCTWDDYQAMVSLVPVRGAA